ncbi:enoyl-CoA hydratase/isomerase family protein [Thermodesulfobacteriota bacterium]
MKKEDSMDYQTIILEKKGYVAIVTLNRPEKLNALNQQMHQELNEVLNTLDDDVETRVIIITGKGRGFCSGRDTKELFSPEEVDRRRERDLIRFASMTRPLFLPKMAKPTIAAVNGLAVGGGCLIALGTDIRIASEAARFKFPFTELGGSSELGSSYFLPRLVGIAKACELVFTAKWVGAKEAKEIGLVNEVVPNNDLYLAALEMAKNISNKSPLAVRASKKGLYQGMHSDLASQLQWETLSLHYLRGTEDFKEASKAFVEKRDGNFKEK